MSPGPHRERMRMTSDQSVEHVLVVPTSLFHEIGHFMGMDEETLEKRGYG